jgi:hypothetical protein
VTNIPSAANLGLENHKIHCIRGREEEKEKLQLSSNVHDTSDTAIRNSVCKDYTYYTED